MNEDQGKVGDNGEGGGGDLLASPQTPPPRVDHPGPMADLRTFWWPPGIPNKLTIELKAMIEGALADIGGQDWLASAATREPAAFMSLLGKLLPKDVNLKGSLDLKSMSLEEIKAEIARLLPQLQATSEPTSESDLC